MELLNLPAESIGHQGWRYVTSEQALDIILLLQKFGTVEYLPILYNLNELDFSTVDTLSST